MLMHNFIKIFKTFQEIGLVSLFFRTWTSATLRSIPNDIWRFLGLHLVNINMYAKFHHNSPLSSAIFTFSEFGARHNLDRCEMPFCNLLGKIWQSLCLDHVNSNGYAKFYQNIPKGSRDSASFTFFQNLHLGKTSTYPKYHLTISLATSCQYQCVCKLTAKYSSQF